MSDLPDEVVFRKSSFAEGSSCVEVGTVPSGAIVLRHSALPGLGELPFSCEEWDAFIRGVKDGEFDVPAPRAED